MRRGEFNIWAYGLQALDSGKSSLNYRVIYRSDIGGILLALLGGLSDDFEGCLGIGKDTSKPPKLWPAGSNPAYQD
jgi:hypothetical protein